MQLVLVCSVRAVELGARPRGVLAVLVVGQAGGPSARGCDGSIHADLGFVGADAGAPPGVDGSVDLRELVVEELAVIVRFLLIQWAWVQDQRLSRRSALSIEGLELSMHRTRLLCQISLARKTTIFACLFQHFVVIEMV